MLQNREWCPSRVRGTLAAMRIGRRRFIASTGFAATSITILGLAGLLPRWARARDYGELVPDPDGILDLPRGFSYKILETAGDSMSDGYVVPGRPDGMGCFETQGGKWALLRNHEVGIGDAGAGAYGFGQAPAQAYNSLAFGGVTRLVVDPERVERISSNLVLAGTVRNCAGGWSPWGWLTCEEDTTNNLGARHGYVFLCGPDVDTVSEPVRIDAYGRFNHEAAVVDAETLICYLTEDRGDSCLYRMVPEDPNDPFAGKLQALRVIGQDNFATTTMQVGDMVDADWVDIDTPDPDSDSVRSEAQDAGAAIFVRGEGICMFEGAVYICSTSGGAAQSGQIFKLVDTEAGSTLELVAMSEDSDVLDAPDNIIMAPWGQLFMAEDGGGENYIRTITENAEIVSFARNAVSDSEIAGPCFSPDGKVLFVNLQGDGLTLAITGPFPEVPGGGDDGGSSGGGDSGGNDSGGDASGDAGSSGSGAGDGASGSGGDGHATGPGSAGPGGGTENPSTGTETDGSGQSSEAGSGCGCDADANTRGAVPIAAAVAAIGLLERKRSDE